MATIIVVSESEHALPSLDALGHTVTRVSAGIDALDLSCDLVVVDAAGNLTKAQQACTILASRPVLLCCPVARLRLLDSAWSYTDLITDESTADEWRLRLQRLVTTTSVTESAGITIDEASYTAHARGVSLDLTYTEFELLKFLVTHPGRVFTRDQLVNHVWGYDYFGGTRTVDVHVRRLRAKLGPELDQAIETVRNVGYRFTDG